MKRIALLFIAAMLVASPALAAGKTSGSIQGSGQAGKAQIINQTEIGQNNTFANVGKNNEMEIGGVSNVKSGQVINQTRIGQNNTFANVGEGNEMRVGTVRQD